MGAFCSRSIPKKREENKTMPKQYHQRTASEWADIIRECKSSGQSDYHWCHEHGISMTSFYRNLKKFHDTSILELPAEMPSGKAAVPVQEVVPLQVIDDRHEKSRPAVMEENGFLPAARLLVNGMTIELGADADPSFISGILKAASSIC